MQVAAIELMPRSERRRGRYSWTITSILMSVGLYNFQVEVRLVSVRLALSFRLWSLCKHQVELAQTANMRLFSVLSQIVVICAGSEFESGFYSGDKNAELSEAKGFARDRYLKEGG